MKLLPWMVEHLDKLRKQLKKIQKQFINKNCTSTTSKVAKIELQKYLPKKKKTFKSNPNRTETTIEEI